MLVDLIRIKSWLVTVTLMPRLGANVELRSKPMHDFQLSDNHSCMKEILVQGSIMTEDGGDAVPVVEPTVCLLVSSSQSLV